MSSADPPSREGVRFRNAQRLAAFALVALCAAHAHAQHSAQTAPNVFDAWASWALAPKVWKGQTVPMPDAQSRPAGAFVRLASQRHPVHLQLRPDASPALATAALAALDAAYEALEARAWPLPPPDGGTGGTAGFDLYVTRGRCTAACAGVDASPGLGDFDSAITYGLVSSDLPLAALPACIQSALAQAGLRASDPAEAESWVIASGELAALSITGESCANRASEAQQTPERGFLNADPDSGYAGALFLGMQSARHDRERDSLDFVRHLWESTRQRSRGLVPGDRLRASPDLWEVLKQTLAARQGDLDSELVEFAAARYFAGPPQRRAHAAYALFAGLPSDAAVPIARELWPEQLPTEVHGPELSALGSAYVVVHTPARSHQLRVWLRGEWGPRWSLCALRLSADERELGRTSVPLHRAASSYLPIALDEGTDHVLLAIMQAPEATPDADRRPTAPRAFSLIVALGP